MLVLRLLRDSVTSEREILSQLQTTYGFSPSEGEFVRLEDYLLSKGFATVKSSERVNELAITAAGISLLRRLEDEYRVLVSVIEPSQGDGQGSVSH